MPSAYSIILLPLIWRVPAQGARYSCVLFSQTPMVLFLTSEFIGVGPLFPSSLRWMGSKVMLPNKMSSAVPFPSTPQSLFRSYAACWVPTAREESRLAKKQLPTCAQLQQQRISEVREALRIELPGRRGKTTKVLRVTALVFQKRALGSLAFTNAGPSTSVLILCALWAIHSASLW